MAITLRFVPNFDVSEENLDTKTYQIRKTKRTKEDLNRLKDVIALQGQVEPIQVLLDAMTGKYYLMAGEGRVLALRALNRQAKAIVYTGLEYDDILKISSGTNEARLEMSDWDKTVSIGEYYERKSNGKTESVLKDISSVFGKSQQICAKYISMWNFYKDKQPFIDLFNENRAPSYVVSGVKNVLEQYDDRLENYGKIANIVLDLLQDKNLTSKSFSNKFIDNITPIILENTASKLNPSYSKFAETDNMSIKERNEVKYILDEAVRDKKKEALEELNKQRKISRKERMDELMSTLSPVLTKKIMRAETALDNIMSNIEKLDKNLSTAIGTETNQYLDKTKTNDILFKLSDLHKKALKLFE